MDITVLLMVLLLLLGFSFIVYAPAFFLKRYKKNVPLKKARNEFRKENNIPLFLIILFMTFILIGVLI